MKIQDLFMLFEKSLRKCIQWRIKGGRGGRSPPQEQDELGNPRCLKEVKEEEKTKK